MCVCSCESAYLISPCLYVCVYCLVRSLRDLELLGGIGGVCVCVCVLLCELGYGRGEMVEEIIFTPTPTRHHGTPTPLTHPAIKRGLHGVAGEEKQTSSLCVSLSPLLFFYFFFPSYIYFFLKSHVDI